MRYVLLISISLLVIIIIYLYLKVQYIENNVNFNIKVAEFYLPVGTGDRGFNIKAKFLLDIINNSNFDINLKKLRLILVSESRNIVVYSDEVKIVNIPKYDSTLVELITNVKINTGAFVEAFSVVQGNEFIVNYKVIGKLGIFPFFYSGTHKIGKT